MHTKLDMTNLSEASLTEAFDNDEKLKEISGQIAQDLESKKYNVADFVVKLEFALTSPTIDLRVNGTKLLSCALANTPKDLLTGKQLEFVATFYSDRLNDQHNVIPAVIDGIAAMVTMKNFPDASVVTILQSFFQRTTCQSQVRGDREKIFKIFELLTERYENVLKSMGGDFIYGLISSLDGERDPRNLELIFTFMPRVIQRFPLLHLYEEMFEIFACYFPIDFTPNKNDPAAITRHDLAQKLANCLTASEQFVEWIVPLALEKLESDLIVAMLDSFELLILTAQKFPAKALEPYFEQIWKSIKQEIFPGVDNQEVLNGGLRALRAILEQSATEPNISHNYQTIVLGTILPHLSDIYQRLFNPSTTIALVCVGSDPRFASAKILDSFLLKLHSEEELKPQEKVKIFNILAQVFKLCSSKNAIREIKSEITMQLHSEFLKGLKEDNSQELKEAALSCLNESIVSVSETNRALVYQSLVQLLTSEDSDIDLRNILRHIAEFYPIELQSHCIDNCIRNFPIFSEFVKRKIYRNFLHLVNHKAFTRLVFNLIFSNIFKNDSPEVRVIALDALIDLLQSEDDKFIEDLHMHESLIEKIFTLVEGGKLKVEALERCATVLSLMVKHLSIAEQYVIVTQYLPKMNLQLESDLFLTKGLLAFMHQDISIDDHFESLSSDLTELSLKSDNESVRTVAHHLLCSLFNKMEDNEINKGILHRVVEKLKEEIKQNSAKAVEILSWIAKGLNVRGYSEIADIIETLAELLDHPTLSAAANLAFEILSAEYPVIHLPVVKFLFKQRFFTLVLSAMSKKLECFSENHLNAFIYVLKATPHSVLAMNIERIGPVLFKCLEMNRVHTILIALEICTNFIKAKHSYFNGHFNHLVPQCLQLSQFKESMTVRIAALNLLYEISEYPTYILLPLKIDVVLGLAPALDDQKRLVRSAAVKARNAWYLKGEPNGD